jgi:ribosomal protein S18 acetylase RimI-like enzyme
MNREEHTLTVRRFTPEDWRLYRDLRLRALQDAPDAFGSTYAHECERADTDWRTRLARGSTSNRDLPLVAEVDGEPGGLAWACLEDEVPAVAHLYQMWVAPECRRQGVGGALLDAAVAWARTVESDALMLDVTVSNGPAVHLYEQAGFVPVGNPKPLRPGSPLQSRSLRLSFAIGSAEASA